MFQRDITLFNIKDLYGLNWSPNGSEIIFSSSVGSITEDGNKDLLVLDAAWIPAMNVNVIRIINDIEFDVTPDWFSPPKLICSKCIIKVWIHANGNIVENVERL